MSVSVQFSRSHVTITYCCSLHVAALTRKRAASLTKRLASGISKERLRSMLVRSLWTSAYRLAQQAPLRLQRDMEKCYVRRVPDASELYLTFLYGDPPRQYNFTRCAQESVRTLQQRIAANIARISRKKKKKNAGREPDPEPPVSLWVGSQPVDEETICEDLLENIDLRLQVAQYTYKIVVNPPWVLSVALPSSMLSSFPVYPVNFKTQFAQKEHCVFLWYKGRVTNDKGNKLSEEHVEWVESSSGYTYTPFSDVIGMKLKLKCIPGDGVTFGPAVEAISPVCVEAGPGKCPFETRQVFTQTKLTGASFRVVSYNILADLYCDSDYTRKVLHPYCPPYALHIDYRKQLVLKELLGYNADIACLQEVDKKIFIHELEPVLGANSYEGVFMRKGKESAEGLACFFRKDRFSLMNRFNIIFSEELASSACFSDIWDLIKDNQPLKDRILDRSTAGQATVLKSIDNPNEILVVGNTHLYFHPDADHIRLIHGGMMIYWLQDLVKNIQTENPNSRISLLICGDFNSVPYCGVYQLYTTGTAPSSLDDWKSNAGEAVSGLSLNQELLLGSACGTPEYTNFTAGFADCLDYIFYDKRSITVEQVVPFPSEEELRQHTALPSVVFPSDHICLIADLAFVN